MAKGASRGLPEESLASLLRSSQLGPGPWVRVGVRTGDPRQLFELNIDTGRRAAHTGTRT